MKRELSYTAFEPQVDYPYFSAMDRIDFSRSAEASAAGAYCPGMAWLLGEMSMLAYHRDVDQVRAALARVHPSVEVQPVFGAGVNAFLVRTPTDAFLIFRGTEKNDPGTLVADLKFRLIPDEEGLAHMGFKEAWASVAEQVVERYKGRRLWITGHSLGAALALFAGADLPACAVYTYGAPRVGDGAFRDAIRVPVWRIVNNNDFVPMLPPPLLYRHAGEARYIDHQGAVTTEDSVWRRTQSQLQGHRDHLGELFREWTRGHFLALPSANISDHAPINYVQALKAALVSSTSEKAGEDAGASNRFQVDGRALVDWGRFHAFFAETFGFPEAYDESMSAWNNGMHSFCQDRGLVSLHIENAGALKAQNPEAFAALVEGSGFINWRETEAGGKPVIALSFSTVAPGA